MRSAVWSQWILLKSSFSCSEVKEHNTGTSLMQSKAYSERQSLLTHKTRLLCFLFHFQPCNLKNAAKLYIKTLAKGMCQSLFITYSLSMKAIMRSFMCCGSVWLSKQKFRDIRADETSVQTEMTTFWQKKRWSCFLLTSTVTTLNYRFHWFRLHWNVKPLPS